MNKWSISSRTIILGLAPAIFMFFALSIYFVNDKLDVLQTQLKHKGELLVQQLSLAAEYAVFIKNPTLLEDIVGPVLNEKDVAFIEFFDPDNILLLSRRNEQFRDTVYNLDEFAVFSSEIVLQDIPLENNDFDLGLSNEQIAVPSQVIGRINVGLSNNQVRQEQKDALIGGLFIAITSLFFSTFLALFIARTISHPVKALSETVKLFKNGMLSARVNERSGGELGILEQNLNALAMTLEQAKRRELEHAMALEQARSDAEDANRAKSEFLSNMSVELKSPLRKSISMLQSLGLTTLTEEQHRFLENSIVSTDQLLILINDIMDYSNLENDNNELQYEYFDPIRVFNRCSAPFVSQYKIKQTKINLFIEAEPENILIYTDELRFQQIILNILAHSIKLTNHGYIDIHVKWHINPGKSSLLLKVDIIDTGSGIAPDQLPFIFDSFSYSEASLSKKVGSTGLGLAIAKKLANRMGGTISVTSEQDKGTHFKLEFNFRFQLEDESSLKTDFNSHLNLEHSIDIKILLIEDNPVNLMVTKSMLNNFGAVVDTAINGRIALNKFKHNEYDLVIVDCELPELDGVECTRKMRALERTTQTHTPIIAITSKSEKFDKATCIEAGVDTYLLKPVSRQLLWSSIDTLMKQGR